VPSRPYFHGGEEFYLQDGALIAHSRSHPIPSGMSHETVKVLTTDRRYELGHGMVHRGGFDGCVWGDRRADRRYRLRSVEALIHACREVYGPRARYAIQPPEEGHGLSAA
jgi:hypothetical protein